MAGRDTKPRRRFGLIRSKSKAHPTLYKNLPYPQPGEQPPKAKRIDSLCSECGRVYKGPDRGRILGKLRAPRTSRINGHTVSHGLCPTCAAKGRKRRAAERKKRGK